MQCCEEKGREFNYNRSEAVFIPACVINSFSKGTICKGEKDIAKYQCCKNDGPCLFQAGAPFHKIIIQNQYAGYNNKIG